jgi:16S rRNA (guanine527-N7)-methyltransferase
MMREPPLTREAFAEATGVSRETLDRLSAYLDCLTKWQSRIGLVGETTMDDPWRRHLLDCQQLAKLFPKGAGTLTDLGSGAGFPGLVLAVTEGVTAHLVEANARKAAFLREAVRVTQAPAVVCEGRVEAIEPWPTTIITARALAPLSDLLRYALPFLDRSRELSPVCMFLKGRKWRQELTTAKESWHMRIECAPSATDSSSRILILQDISPRRAGRGPE